MRILVTGGTGFIGSRLASSLGAQGHRVLALGRVRSAEEERAQRQLEVEGIEVHDVSVTEPRRLETIFEGVERVFHLAAAHRESNVPDEYFRRINVDGTRHVFEAALRTGVGRVVHGSTIGVYGWWPGHTVGLASPLDPDNIYGATKLLGEEVVRGFEGRVDWVIARLSETYGPGDRRILKLFRGIDKGLYTQIGPSRNLHHLVFVDDLIEGLVAAGETREASGRTFVLAGPRAVETREMMASIAHALGKPTRALRIPIGPLLGAAALLETLMRPFGIEPPLHRRRMDFFRKSFCFDGEEAKSVLGYEPQTALNDGLAITAAWYRQAGWL